MSFRTADVLRFVADKNTSTEEVEKITRRAREACGDYPGREGDEFAHSRLNFVLGRALAEQYRTEHSVPA